MAILSDELIKKMKENCHEKNKKNINGIICFRGRILQEKGEFEQAKKMFE